jgi:hypothetical protein
MKEGKKRGANKTRRRQGKKTRRQDGKKTGRAHERRQEEKERTRQEGDRTRSQEDKKAKRQEGNMKGPTFVVKVLSDEGSGGGLVPSQLRGRYCREKGNKTTKQ